MLRFLMVASAVLLTSSAIAQDPAKIVYYTGQQIENDIRKAPANETASRKST